jgi:glycine reductase
MKLELGTFPVRDIILGSSNRYAAGLVEIDKRGLELAILSDGRIQSVDIQVAKPGESCRITKVHDVLQPMVKVSGPGTCYPGVCGRPVATVGAGRTHRLGGLTVMELAEMPMYEGYDSPVEDFVDMSGPAAELSPYADTINVALRLVPSPGLSILDQNEATHGAALLASDTLAGLVKEMEPPELATYELPLCDPQLPRAVYITCIRSSEHYSNSVYAFWTGIYGLTRLTPPWLLHPNELLDGAISAGSPYHGPAATSWVYANNPVVQEMYRLHGREISFAGVIAIRTRWSAQFEKDITSNQAAKLAQMVGAKGAVVTWDAGGNDFMETIRTVQACEKIGIKTVFLTGEESPESGGPPLLEPLPEADAIVSTGFGGHANRSRAPLPTVERIVGFDTIAENIMLPKEQVPARSGLQYFRGRDIYGFSRLSAHDY